MEEWNAGTLKTAVEVNRKARKDHKDKGMRFIPLGFRLTRPVIAWLSAWVEKNSIFSVLFAFFAVKQLRIQGDLSWIGQKLRWIADMTFEEMPEEWQEWLTLTPIERFRQSRSSSPSVG